MLESVRTRRSIAIGGVVQGVGFRPFVHRVASLLGFGGFVRNRAGGVLIEVEGESEALERFLDEVRRRPPPLARIEEISWLEATPRGESRFQIEESSAAAGGAVLVSPDVATCDDCVREMFDAGDRRFRHPFLNCTNCGPRLTVVTGAPYDRERTTMARFALCADCSAEYHDPGNRRFHAQPTCCPRCGPTLRALDARGIAVDEPDPVAFAARELSRGRIGAIKGIGGYHLACDARREQAVAELRRRKARDEKPFAVMVRDLEAAAALCRLSPEERALLASPPRPIVLLERRAGAGVAASVAPRSPQLVPYAPLHHLLLREAGGPLVMTSGNRSDEAAPRPRIRLTSILTSTGTTITGTSTITGTAAITSTGINRGTSTATRKRGACSSSATCWRKTTAPRGATAARSPGAGCWRSTWSARPARERPPCWSAPSAKRACRSA